MSGHADSVPWLIRSAGPQDAREVARCTVAAYRAVLGSALSDRYAEELGRADARIAEATVLVALDDTRAVVGAVTYVQPASPWCEWDDPAAAGIRTLAVDPGAQGRGIGAALVHACIDRARRDGYERVVLHSQPEMTAARALYERLGFVRHPAMDWTPVPGVILDGFRLELD